MPTTPFIQTLFADGRTTVSFERFMTVALHDPELGYYARKAAVVGADGDFATTATLHPILGQAIASWIRTLPQWKSRPVDLVEVGAGNGALATAILESFSWWDRRRLRYHIVESSSALADVQRAKLNKFNVTWHRDLRTAPRNRSPIMFSNELVDAFPCMLLQKTDQGWAEIHLRSAPNNQVKEELRDLTQGRKVPSSTLDNATWQTGQRVEIHHSYHEWLNQHLSQFENCTLLTIDYGDVVESLYQRRPQGSLRGYFKHMRFEGPEVYQNPGHQDITADVNFTDLQNWGDDLGLRTLSLTNQEDFLRTYASRDTARATANPVLAGLLDPSGAGGVFKVLIQSKV